MITKQVCVARDCGWCGTSVEVLKALNPFNPEKVLWGCPKCKEIGTLYLGCDKPGCRQPIKFGVMTLRGYSRRCAEHKTKAMR